MKTFLKFSGAIAAVVALVAWILMMATPVAKYSTQVGTSTIDGTVAIFGKDVLAGHVNLAWTAILAWILILVALIILISAVVLPLLKVTALNKVAGILNLVAVCALIVAGIFMFSSKAALSGANHSAYDGFAIGAGWVIGGILSIVAGACAICPAVADFLAKK